jgi:hypothetical protein
VAKQNTQKPVNERPYNRKVEGKVAKQNTQNLSMKVYIIVK